MSADPATALVGVAPWTELHEPPRTPPWQLAPPVAASLETTMTSVLGELVGDLGSSAARAVELGGKRLRPALTLAVALGTATGREPNASALRAAAGVEMLHQATLVHDDLIDGADLRHGRATVAADEGTGSAVITGDLLIAAAHVCAADVGRSAALATARTLADLCRGETLQDRQQFRADLSEDDAVAVARLKSGSLLRLAAVLGGEVAGYGPGVIDALGRFGLEFGTALQLVDDLLDVFADAAVLGKPAGADFANGTVTVPAIVAMRRHPDLAGLLRPDLDDASRRRALRMLRCAAAARISRAAAVDHATRAALALRDAADEAPPEYRSALLDLAAWPAEFVRRQLQTVPHRPESHRCTA